MLYSELDTDIMLVRHASSTSGQDINPMPGTKTAPAVDSAAPTYVELQVRWIDYTGDLRSNLYLINAAATDIEINAFVDSLQAASNASIYEISKRLAFASVEDSSNAVEDVWEDIATNVVIQLKDAAAKTSRQVYIPAPINGMFIEQTEEINPANATLASVLTDSLALNAGYSVVGARFTQRRARNPQVKI